MKVKLESQLQQAIEALKQSGVLDSSINPKIIIERARDDRYGDFACNIAMIMAKQAKMKPKQLAEQIVACLPEDGCISRVEIAGPGFINFFIDPASQYDIIHKILDQGHHFGRSSVGKGQKIQIEFVSANPTGPLHVGHGRGAAYGSVVADLLEAIGYQVEREYYVNDAGRQMDILTTSIWLRYLEACGEPIPFPANAYRGEYIRDIAWKLHADYDNEYRRPGILVLENLPLDEAQGGDREEHIDALIERCKTLLGNVHYQEIFQAGLDSILADIRNDLEEFGVHFQAWFSERILMDDGSVRQALTNLQQHGFLYEKNGATWFASSRLGDEKDRVVIRENGQTTYFASDIAYHVNKLNRGYDRIIDVWGADHHGYIPRVKAALQAMDSEQEKLNILLVQFAVLYRGEEKVSMSTRSGEFITLRQLRNEVGKDAARFFYVMRRADQHMDFDLQLATSQSNDNPVFYVQYAHARVCSVLRQLDEKGWERDLSAGLKNLTLLTENHELNLLNTLSRYPEVLQRSANLYEPHQLITYLRKLATELHAYYNAHQFLVEDELLRNARLNLISAVKQILANGLGLLGINAPESM